MESMSTAQAAANAPAKARLIRMPRRRANTAKPRHASAELREKVPTIDAATGAQSAFDAVGGLVQAHPCLHGKD